MPNKMIYIRKGDESFWERAEEKAQSRGVALSVWLSDLVRNHFYSTGAGQAPDLTPAQQLAEAEATIARVRAQLEDES